MSALVTATAIAGIVAGVFSTLCFEVFSIACMPNSTAASMRSIRRTMLVGGAAGLLVMALAIWLLMTGRPWWAAATGVSPAVIMMTVLYGIALAR